MTEKARILVVGPRWIGDMVMAECLVRALAERWPEAEIDILAEPPATEVCAFMPGVRRAITMPFRRGELGPVRRWRLARALRAERYDRAYVLPRALKKAALPWLARIPVRVGLADSRLGGLLTDFRPPVHPHQVDRFVALARPSGAAPRADLAAPRLAVTSEQRRAAEAEAGIAADGGPVLVLVPGSGGLATKRWPADRFAAVARARLAAGWRVWVFGSAAERDLADAIRRDGGAQALDFCGLPLASAIPLMLRADQVLSNDSGLMHVAAALGRPTVGLFGPSDPALAAPRADHVRALSRHLACSPCMADPCPLAHHDCLAGLAAATVLAAMDEQVAGRGETPLS